MSGLHAAPSSDALESGWPSAGAALVERGAHLDQLRELLARAERGQGATRFVAGEGGVGKTRLLEAIVADAERREWRCLTGRAYPVETGVPFAVFADAFLPTLRAFDAARLDVLTRGGLADLVQLFPALGAALGRAPGAARGEGPEQKARLLWTFSQLVARLAAQKPTLVVLENLQWADASSLELLHFVARQLGSEKLVLLASYNSAERAANPALAQTERSLASLGVARVVDVEPLTVGGVRELVRRTFGADPASVAPFAERLHARTAGNPLFVGETLKALVDSGALTRRGGVWRGWEVEELGVPRTVRDTVAARLAGLPPDARRVADLAAVLGARATHDALAAVSRLSGDALLTAVDELRARHVLAEVPGDGDVAYDFTHPMLRDVLYQELGRARARALHGVIAAALERHWGARVDAHVDELAYHFSRAEARAHAAQAVRYLARAGEGAAARQANREAAEYLSAALALLDEEATGGADAGRVVETLARVRQRLGDYDGALALWRRARDAARADGDDLRLAAIQRTLGLAAFWTGRFADALSEYDAGLEVATRVGVAAGAARARLLVARGMCHQAIGRPEEAERDVREALAAAEPLGDAALLARVHRALLLLYLWTGPEAAARDHGRRAIELSLSAGDRATEWSAHWGLATLGGLTGHACEVARHLADAERLAVELRSPLREVWTAEVAVEYHAGIGEWEVAVARAERAVAMARALGQRTLLPRLLVWAALLHVARGDEARGRAYVEEAWTLAGAEREDGEALAADPREVHSLVPAHIGRAGLHLARREWAEAIAVGERGLRIADRSGYVVWSIHRLLPILAEAALWAADHDRARALGLRLREESARLGHPLGLAWADACFAVQELLQGDRARSVAMLRSAVAALERIPYVEHAARLRRVLARSLAETGDPESALDELRVVHEVLERLGATRELAETREQMRLLGARPPSVARQASPAAGAFSALTGRELDIVRHVARRRSNKEIGVALGISARTVSTHLSNIFGKLGVGSRGELTDLAREAGTLEG